jgi:hypothetical protein
MLNSVPRGYILSVVLAYAIQPDLPARIRDSVALVEAVRAPRAGVDPAVAALRQLADEALGSMRGILAVSLGDRIQTGDAIPNEKSDAERAGYLADLNEALTVVRRSLEQYESADFDTFVRSIRTYAPDLGAELQRTRREFAAYTRQVERTLILFGAGTRDDADLIDDLVPDVA